MSPEKGPELTLSRKLALASAVGACGKNACLLRKLLFQTAADQFTELEDRRIGNRVEHLESFFSPGQHVGLGERLQVTPMH